MEFPILFHFSSDPIYISAIPCVNALAFAINLILARNVGNFISTPLSDFNLASIPFIHACLLYLGVDITRCSHKIFYNVMINIFLLGFYNNIQ